MQSRSKNMISIIAVVAVFCAAALFHKSADATRAALSISINKNAPSVTISSSKESEYLRFAQRASGVRCLVNCGKLWKQCMIGCTTQSCIADCDQQRKY